MVDQQGLKEVMRFWATGVSVVSAAFEGQEHGMTVNSFTSVSLEPPLVLVSLRQGTRTHKLVEDAGAFGISLLAQEQKRISNRFAGRLTEDKDRFYGLETFSLETGSPLLAGGMAALDCKLVDMHPVGTHTLFIGEVVAAQVSEEVGELPPLLYFNREYRKLGE